MKTLNQIQSELSPETWDDLVQHFALQKQAFSDEKAALEAAVQTALREKAQAVQSANLADAGQAAAAEAHAAALAQAAADQAAAVEAAKLEIQTNLDALVQAAEDAFDARNEVALGAVIAQARGYTTAARRAKIEADIAAALQAKAEAEAKLAALTP